MSNEQFWVRPSIYRTIAILIAFAAPAAHAELWKCVNERGDTYYTAVESEAKGCQPLGLDPIDRQPAAAQLSAQRQKARAYLVCVKNAAARFAKIPELPNDIATAAMESCISLSPSLPAYEIEARNIAVWAVIDARYPNLRQSDPPKQ